MSTPWIITISVISVVAIWLILSAIGLKCSQKLATRPKYKTSTLTVMKIMKTIYNVLHFTLFVFIVTGLFLTFVICSPFWLIGCLFKYNGHEKNLPA